jgi:hypothetical protein
MSRGKKMATVAFKADAGLAELLDRLPNKSEFIRKAIMAHFSTTCPLCQGKGVVSRGIHDHFEPVIKGNRRHPCTICGNEQYLPVDPGELNADDRARLEQFFMGGPLYCDNCYRTVSPCSECGWHIDSDRINEHVRSRHSEQP